MRRVGARARGVGEGETNNAIHNPPPGIITPAYDAASRSNRENFPGLFEIDGGRGWRMTIPPDPVPESWLRSLDIRG